VRRPDVTVSGTRLSARIPLHAAEGARVGLRFTASGRTLHTSGTLTGGADGPGSLLEATLPARLPRGIWRVALSPDPDAAQPAWSGLPFALRAAGDSVLVVTVPRPGTVRKLVRAVRRVLGTARTKAARVIDGRR